MLNKRLLEEYKQLESKNYFSKYKEEFKEMFKNFKITIQNNKKLKNIFLKYYNGETITTADNYILRKVLKDNLKLVGLGSLTILSFPLPGSSFLIMLLIKGAQKLGINLIPTHVGDDLIFMAESVDTEIELIDITKLSQTDWKELQLKVRKDCFPNEPIESIPVEISNNRSNAATFQATRNRRTNEIFNKKYTFNKRIKWYKEKLYNVMAHEMIHHLMTLRGHFREQHGYRFREEMYRINNLNNGYRVTLTDDEFILTDNEANKITSYLYIFYKDGKNHFNFTASSPDVLDNRLDEIEKRYSVDFEYFEVYTIPQHIQVRYGIRNRRTLKLVRYNQSTIDEILKDENVKLVKTYKNK